MIEGMLVVPGKKEERLFRNVVRGFSLVLHDPRLSPGQAPKGRTTKIWR